MKNKAVPVIIFLVVAVALVAVIVFISNGSKSDTTTSAPHETTNPGAKTYTLAVIATHKDATSCWTTVNGGVYDLTSWIDQHPGGRDAILGLCGKDGTSAFTAQHGGQARPEQELASLKIGMLAQ